MRNMVLGVLLVIVIVLGIGGIGTYDWVIPICARKRGLPQAPTLPVPPGSFWVPMNVTAPPVPMTPQVSVPTRFSY